MGLVDSEINSEIEDSAISVSLGDVTAGNALVVSCSFAGDQTHGDSQADVEGTTLAISGGGTGSWVQVHDTTNGQGMSLGRIVTWVKASSGGGAGSGDITVTFGGTIPAPRVSAIAAAEFTPISTILGVPYASNTSGGFHQYTVENPFTLIWGPIADSRGQSFLYSAVAIWGSGGGASACRIGGVSEGDVGHIPANTRPWEELGLVFEQNEPSGDTVPGSSVGMGHAWVEIDTPVAGDAPVYWYGTGHSAGDATNAWVAHTISLALVGEASEFSGVVPGYGEGFAMLTAPHSSAIPVSPIPLPERWFFGGVDLQEYGTLYLRATGKNALPPLRGNPLPYAGLEGRQAIEGLYDSRTLPFTIMVLPAGPEHELVESSDLLQAHANLRALQRVLSVRAEQQLMYVAPTGDAYVAAATVSSVVERPLDSGGRESPWMVGLDVDFLLSDPWFYGLTVSGGPTTISSSGQLVTITHPGEVPGERLILEFRGTFTNLQIRNMVNGSTLSYSPAVSATQRLHFNVRKREARVNGALVLGSVEHWSPPGSTSWMVLEPGDNPLEITGSVVGGTMTYSFHPPFV